MSNSVVKFQLSCSNWGDKFLEVLQVKGSMLCNASWISGLKINRLELSVVENSTLFSLMLGGSPKRWYVNSPWMEQFGSNIST